MGRWSFLRALAIRWRTVPFSPIDYLGGLDECIVDFLGLEVTHMGIFHSFS